MEDEKDEDQATCHLVQVAEEKVLLGAAEGVDVKSIEDMTLPEIDDMLFAVKGEVLKLIPETANFILIACTDGDKVSPVFISTLGEDTRPILEHVVKAIGDGKYILTKEKPDE